MRVLINNRPSLLHSKTGIGYVVLNLYIELLNAGIDVTPTISMKTQKCLGLLSYLSSKLRNHLGRYYPTSMLEYVDHIINNFNKSSSKRSYRYDIYNETEYEPMSDVRADKIVFNLYDLALVRYPHFFDKVICSRRTTYMIENAKKADRILVNTEFTKKEAIDILKIDASKIDVIPLAASSGYYKIKNRDDLKRKIKRYTKKDYILCVSTVEPRKNLKTLIKAFKEVRRRLDLSLLIVGGFGWLYDDILSLPEELGIKEDVIFTGYVEEDVILSLYNNSLCFVYPSFYEGFGMPPLEAMACGTPTILSDIPPLREVAGDAVLYFDPHQTEQLAHLIENVILSPDLRDFLSRSGLERASLYTWKRSSDLVIKSYKKALMS